MLQTVALHQPLPCSTCHAMQHMDCWYLYLDIPPSALQESGDTQYGTGCQDGRHTFSGASHELAYSP